MSIQAFPELIISMGSYHSYGTYIEPHSHSRAQLLYASKGTMRVQTQGSVWVVPTQYALWIPALCEHSVTPMSEICLSTVLVEKNAAHVMGEKCYLLRMSNLLKALVLRLNDLDQIEKDGIPYSDELKIAIQRLIFDEIQRALVLPIEIPWPVDRRLDFICHQLMSQPHQYKDLNHWSEKIGTSSRTLMRLFKKETGLQYRSWVQQLHLSLALDDLSNGRSIAYISSRLGYATTSAFSTMFKRHLGYTPKLLK
ncbi:AraC family transcriptional regulator [Acinetobacter pollinis]|uniref:AraC family transcriptional regulator n=1 Tax=Acinetobacter pollinis TaxID=2605270 RepID=UPI0018A2EA25|nr:helix-turn-helix transcriptional regulator [Acinetobacter pollinis]MBF7691553.1 helix-turn-helix transcriptional regulator [Acinetobacter pollinis]MBF7693939.1 helix-turn-helix transcriptional regulator [Acinetobacter pollinis]MBF7699045.1 helix-turn-helix transcriptional regulator [Acinetobacter pollinis]MBF7701595.1 helix-turn-helix transcriptional regulator [Acinetobacter pollinis]